MFHELTDYEWSVADAIYLNRCTTWDPEKWDYTEWEELDDEIRGRLGIPYGVLHNWSPPK